MYSAILLSGGKGSRMKKNIPKQYLLLAGKPIIMHSVERLDNIEEIEEIVIVCDNEYVDKIKTMFYEYSIKTNVIFAQSGKSRQQSVYNGLGKIKNDRVIIHEAARPFAMPDDFYQLINSQSDNAMLGYDIPYTVIKGNDNKVSDLLNRSELVNVQLPQKFLTKDLKNAHEKAKAENREFTEDAGMVYYYEKSNIEIVKGSNFNIKITEPIDMLYGDIIYKEYIARRK